MRIFLLAYTRQNLGDDLFIQMLLEKYSDCDFYLKIKDPSFVQYFSKYSNLHIIVGDNSLHSTCNMNVEEYDAFVYIGGSIFMEGRSGISDEFCNFLERLNSKHIPFYYISSSYGPYKTQDFVDLSKRAFSNIRDICFRDKYSYNLFKDISTVRYAPDLVFSSNLTMNKKISNSIGISVIHFEKIKHLKHLEHCYINFLTNNIDHYLSQGKKVYMFSFCKYEGDEATANAILKHFKNHPNIVLCYYDGEINKFIEVYSRMEFAICSRFHAMVLSSLFKQKTFVLSYNHKFDNTIQDLNLGYDIIHFDTNLGDLLISDDYFKVIDNNNLLKIKEKAKEQLKSFDELVK